MNSDTTTQQIQLYPELPLTLTKTGSGRPVLVLHGGHGPANAGPVLDHFEATSTVMLPTHPGWNGTPRPDWFSGVDDLANAYLDLLEDEKLDDVVVIATSFGGWIASEMALRDRGHRISRMVLIDPNGPEIPGYKMQLDWEQPGGRPMPPNMHVVYAYAGQSLGDPKLLRRLRRVQTPILLLWGENDPLYPIEYGRAFAAAFGNARFELIPGAAHIPVHEAPEATFAAIDAFLAAS
ncbi:alpha/beta hydrolase [Planotetraspora sp. A-T 1434]|uniref:alpha/beta fold hydrolase n=1 Tax=Planotetraspora sp. A-T 1434 TaxID=2979219 RepID=UPI0021C23D29|nr:alpha/beta hydrolase [Planotetraspora sp. A-T 1434]MCT9933793.1 alpha/beta hydrolase [Planotetraspora sp. A-T 1434]